MHPAPNLVRLFPFSPYPLILFSFTSNNYALSKHGGGGNFSFSSFILGLHFRFLVRIGWVEKTSNDIVRDICIHELECLLMCDPYSVKFLKVL